MYLEPKKFFFSPKVIGFCLQALLTGLNVDITVQGVQKFWLGTKTEWCLICGSLWLPKTKELILEQSVQHQ